MTFTSKMLLAVIAASAMMLSEGFAPPLVSSVGTPCQVRVRQQNNFGMAMVGQPGDAEEGGFTEIIFYEQV